MVKDVFTRTCLLLFLLIAIFVGNASALNNSDFSEEEILSQRIKSVQENNQSLPQVMPPHATKVFAYEKQALNAAFHFFKNDKKVDNTCFEETRLFSFDLEKDHLGEAVINGCKDRTTNIIWIDPQLLKTNWYEYCSVVIHEYGHLLGYDHSSKKTDVMYPFVGADNWQYDACGQSSYVPAPYQLQNWNEYYLPKEQKKFIQKIKSARQRILDLLSVN